MELVDTQDLKSCDHCGRAGSIPAPGTYFFLWMDTTQILYKLIILTSGLAVVLFLVCCNSPEKTSHVNPEFEKIKDIIHNPATASDDGSTYQGPKIEISNKSVYDFGEIDQGGKVEHTFIVKNIGDRSLIIFNTTSSCGCTTSYFKKDNITPGDTTHISVIFDTTNKRGRQRKTVNLHTNCYPSKSDLTLEGNVNEI